MWDGINCGAGNTICRLIILQNCVSEAYIGVEADTYIGVGSTLVVELEILSYALFLYKTVAGVYSTNFKGYPLGSSHFLTLWFLMLPNGNRL